MTNEQTLGKIIGANEQTLKQRTTKINEHIKTNGTNKQTLQQKYQKQTNTEKQKKRTNAVINPSKMNKHQENKNGTNGQTLQQKTTTNKC